jgi:phosphatidylinositol alpha-1,6-mannosyltransferase
MLALVTDAFGGRGGIAQYNRDMLSALGDGLRIVVLPRHAPDPIGTLPRGIAQARSRPGRASFTLHALLLALSERPSVIFCGHLFMAPLAIAVTRLTRAKLIMQLHGVEAWQRPTYLQRLAVEKADLVLCVSRDTRSRVLNWAAIEPERVVVLPNTVADVFVPGDRAVARKRFSLDGEIALLSVGRLSREERYKGQDLIIKALPVILAAKPRTKYLIAGEGDDRGRLERLAQDLGVATRVQFLGQVPDKDLPDLYRAADLFVLPSTGEGFGIVFLEAMASGTPALGLAVAGAKDALADGQLGTATSPANLAADVERLLKLPRSAPMPLCQEVRDRFGHKVFAARAQALIHQLAA